MAPERKLYQDLKRNTPGILWNRIENLAGIGIPDLLGYNTNQHFFTVELKVTKSNSLRFSPHQIAFHKLHPKNSFILAKHLASSRLKLYEGKKIMELVACGLKLDACCSGLAACCLKLEALRPLCKNHHSWFGRLEACRLQLEARFGDPPKNLRLQLEACVS